MAVDMKNFQLTVKMPANSTASSYPRYVQLTFPNGTMFIFETFTATREDWTALFSLVDGHHTIVISFNGAKDWAGIYTLLGTQFGTDRQKKNKDPIVKVSDEEDPSLQPKLIFDDPKRLQAGVISAIKRRIMHQLIELLNCPVSHTYKLAICDHIEFETDPLLPPIPQEVKDVWVERIAANQRLHDRTYQVFCR
uniref:Uncharacterized protein n=1 Tax=Romanomermis culicivorax TaxID=13658 RepID=A0A915HY25_ROMCU